MIQRMKLTEATRDYYRKLAKNAGYRSRSAYKLLQLNRSYGIFRPRQAVVDLGSAPGGWIQVAKQQVGGESLVIGIDIKQIRPLEGVTILRGSIDDAEIIDNVLKLIGGKADIVLSDLSPNLSGIWDVQQLQLFEA